MKTVSNSGNIPRITYHNRYIIIYIIVRYILIYIHIIYIHYCKIYVSKIIFGKAIQWAVNTTVSERDYFLEKRSFTSE